MWTHLEDLLHHDSIRRAELRGYTATAIVEYAEQSDAEMIVIGTRGRGGFASLVLGSTSQAVIHDAHCDVLVVKTSGQNS